MEEEANPVDPVKLELEDRQEDAEARERRTSGINDEDVEEEEDEDIDVDNEVGAVPKLIINHTETLTQTLYVNFIKSYNKLYWNHNFKVWP